MTYGRHLSFWVATFLVLAALLWLLHDMLLPFVAGIALAYVLAPLADRLERLGVNRTIAVRAAASGPVPAASAMASPQRPLRIGHTS